jgi:hypothetical protein
MFWRHRHLARLAALLAGALLSAGCLGSPVTEHTLPAGGMPPPAAAPRAAAPTTVPASQVGRAPSPTPSPAPSLLPTAEPLVAAAPAGGSSAARPPAVDGPPVPAPTPAPSAPSALPTRQPAVAVPWNPGPISPAVLASLEPAPRPGKFRLDLYRDGDHVRQVTMSMCVPASMQMMINIMEAGTPDRSRQTQKELYELARSWSPWLTADRGGASARGWAAGLAQLGYGDFALLTLPTMDEALRAAARQMRVSGKPVGLLVWAGKHAWVMSGFKATADPAFTDDYEVTAVWVEDPWFGRTDRTWGTGLAPHTLITADELADKFVTWRSRYYLSSDSSVGRFVIVAPEG